jgi:hypothetical protein
MAAPIRHALQCLTLLLAMACAQGAAAEPNAFEAALERAAAQYRIALQTLEVRGRDETAAEVSLFRETWGEIIERFGKDRPAAFADDDTYSATLLDIDVRILGVLLVINIGNREAAREAFKPIGETIARLQSGSPPAGPDGPTTR